MAVAVASKADRVLAVRDQQVRVPAPPSPNRLARIEILRHARAHRKPVIRPGALVGVAALIEQPGDLLVVDRLALIRPALTAMTAERTAEDMPELARLELDPAAQALLGASVRRERLSHHFSRSSDP